MAVPLGLSKNFFNLGSQQADDILTGDYTHKKASTVKVKGGTKSSGSFNFKRSWVTKGDSWAYSDEFKVGHKGLGQVYHQMRVDRKGVFKSHFDLGDYQWMGALRNVQVALKYDTAKQTVWARLANSHKSTHCESHQRLEIKPDGHIDWSMRTNLTIGHVSYNMAAIYGLTTQRLTKYDLSATKMLNDHVQLALKHTTPKKTALVGKLMVGLSCQPEETVKAALVGYLNKETGKRRVVAGVTKQLGQHRLRAKVDQKGKVSLAGVFRLSSMMSVTMGGQVSLGGGPTPLGYTCDLTL